MWNENKNINLGPWWSFLTDFFVLRAHHQLSLLRIYFYCFMIHLLSKAIYYRHLDSAEITSQGERGGRKEKIGDRWSSSSIIIQIPFSREQRHAVNYLSFVFCTFPCRCPPHISFRRCRWSGTYFVSFHEKATIKTSHIFFGQQTSPHAIKHSNQVKIEARKNVEIIYCSDMFQNLFGTIEPLKSLKKCSCGLCPSSQSIISRCHETYLSTFLFNIYTHVRQSKLKWVFPQNNLSNYV